jgi:hypothetical protein
MRDTKRKTTSRPAMDNEVGEIGQKKRPHIVGSESAFERSDRLALRSHRVLSRTDTSRGGGCERICVREDRAVVELGAKKLGEKNAHF